MWFNLNKSVVFVYFSQMTNLAKFMSKVVFQTDFCLIRYIYIKIAIVMRYVP